MGKMKKITKAKVLSCLLTQSESFIFTSYKRSNEASNAKNDYYRGSGDMHHLRCVDLLWFHEIHAKGCDTFTGFDSKRISKVVCEGGSNRDW